MRRDIMITAADCRSANSGSPTCGCWWKKRRTFEESNYTGLYGFLSYIDAMKKNNLSMGEAKTIGENENVVRIMTVHKSKGLEFPVVILAGAAGPYVFEEAAGSMEMHKDCGIGLPLVNREEGWHRKTLLQRVIEGEESGGRTGGGSTYFIRGDDTCHRSAGDRRNGEGSGESGRESGREDGPSWTWYMHR